MTVYTEIFGGNTLYPAEPSFLSLTFSSNITLEWPIEQAVGGDGIVAKIIELHPSGAGLSVTLADARLVSTGYAVQFYNAEANTVTIRDNGGNSILTVASGLSWTLYLRDNSTANGLWRSYQAGAGTSTANAASLAGAGLKAITTTLNTKLLPVEQPLDYVIVNADRATVQQWTGGTGDFTLPDPATVGSDWYVGVKNAGSGSVTVTPAAGTLDGSASLIFATDESALIYSDGTNFHTLGYGQSVVSVFDFISINVAGTGDYTLTGVELNRIAYEFTGVLSGNRNIIVPAAVQQYWVDNQTTGAFSLTVKTLAGTGIAVPQGSRTILYCDGTDVLNAETLATNVPSVVQGDLLYGQSPGILAALAKDTNATRYLSNTGSSNNPAWAQVTLVTGVSGYYGASKSATTSRTSDTTSTADPVLALTGLEAGGYQVNVLVQIGGAGAAGFRFQLLQGGGTMTGSVTYVGNVNGATVTGTTTGLNTDNTFGTLSGANDEYLNIHAWVRVTVAGNLSFAWAQNTTNASPTSVFVGYMFAQRVA